MKKILIFLLVLCSVSSIAATYYIDTSGNDTSGNGTIGNPWQSFYKASISVTTSGSIIHANVGTYSENHRCAFAVGVSVEGAGKALTIVKSTYSSTTYSDALFCFSSGLWNTAGNQSVSNIGFDGMDWICKQAIVVYHRGNVTIHDCDFKNFDYTCVGFFGDAYESIQEPSIYITGNKFYNNTVLNCSNYSSNGNQGLWYQGQDGFEIYGCTIKSLRGAGVGGDCISSKTNKRTKIHNNTIERTHYVNYFWSAALEIRWEHGESEIYNNIIKGCIDIPWSYAHNYAYSWWIHDNITGWDTQQPSFDLGIDMEADCYKVIIENNTFKHLSQGIQISVSFMGQPIVFKDITIRNNLFSSIGCTATPFSGQTINAINIGHEATDAVARDFNIYNNTMTGSTNSRYGIYIGNRGTIKNVNIKNNIITGFLLAPVSINKYSSSYALTVDTLNITYNNFYNNGNSNAIKYTDITPTHLNISNTTITNPLFVNSSINDYHLSSNSPDINSGIDVGLPYYGTAPDLGAFEFIGNTNQPPIIVNQNFSTNENSVNGTSVGTVIASDPDAGQTLSYSILSGNTSGAFTINASTGVLTIANSSAINVEVTPSFALVVKVEDNGTGNLSSQAIITINILSTGIELNETNQKINVYPNPVFDELNIEIEWNTDSIGFEILNSIGQLVIKGKLTDKTVVKTTNFTPGIYFLKIENGGTFEFRKIVKD